LGSFRLNTNIIQNVVIIQNRNQEFAGSIAGLREGTFRKWYQ